MATKKVRKAPARKPTHAELADILAFADLNGDRATAEQFKVTLRTLQRYRARIKAGELPEVAELVANKKKIVAERVADLLTETHEKALQRLAECLPDAKIREVIGAVKITGELRLARNVLNPDVEQPEADSPDPSAQRGQAQDPAATRRGAGESGASGSPRAPIH